MCKRNVNSSDIIQRLEIFHKLSNYLANSLKKKKSKEMLTANKKLPWLGIEPQLVSM